MLRRISASSSTTRTSSNLLVSSSSLVAVTNKQIASVRFQTSRQLVRGGGTSEYWVKSPKTRKRIFTIIFVLFIYFQIFAPKRVDYMKKRFDHELHYYSDHDKKYGYQKNYAIGSDGRATVDQPNTHLARPADASGAVTEPEFLENTGKLMRPRTWFGWYSK